MFPGIGAQAAMAVFDRQGAALQARFAERKDNARAAADLRERAGRITDVESLLKDRRALTMVLEAFQLESEIGKGAILRRVLTEDPADEKSLANRMADPRWKELANAFAATRTVSLTTEQIAAQTPAQLRAMQLSSMAGLNILQVQALTAEQVASLDPAQLAAISPEALAGMDAGDIAAMSGEQVAALTPAQLRALAPGQIAAIEPADLARLGADRIRALGAAQVAVLTEAQLGALTYDQVAAFSAEQAGALNDTQLAVFGDVQRAMLAAPRPAGTAQEAAPSRRPLDDRALLDRIVQGVMTNRFEKEMGEDNPGMREALYFRRMASTATSIVGLMSDRALVEVARGSLGLPESFGALEYEQQRDRLTKRLDLANLQDPKEVARMAQRYLLLRGETTTSSPVAALFDTSGSTDGIVALAGRRLSYSA